MTTLLHRFLNPLTRISALTLGRTLLITAAIGLLGSGCSSSSKGKSTTTIHNSNENVWQRGVFNSSETYYEKCANPRTGIDPFTNEPYGDTQGTTTDEVMFVRSILNEYYLWYTELTDLAPTNYQPEDYFRRVLPPRDIFSGVTSYEEFMRFFSEGTQLGYGIKWELNVSNGELIVAYVEPDSLNSAQVSRGDSVISINAINVAEALSTETTAYELYDLLYPFEEQTITVQIQPLSGDPATSVELAAQNINSSAVPLHSTLSANSGEVGYLLFNSHNMQAQDQLFQAVTELNQAGISDLIVDLRFNTGGLISVASQLAYMIAGQEQTQDKIFSQYRFNGKAGNLNPFTGEPNTPNEFLTTLLDDNGQATTALPTLDLNRVFVLTSTSTCSASETLINGLMGIDVEVIQIGDTTCGKPYGFIPIPNCGSVYQFTAFETTNHKGNGGYSLGFSADSRAIDNGSISTTSGCAVMDLILAPLGDPDDSLIASALEYINTGQCSSTTAYRPMTMVESAMQLKQRQRAWPLMPAPLPKESSQRPYFYRAP